MKSDLQFTNDWKKIRGRIIEPKINFSVDRIIMNVNLVNKITDWERVDVRRKGNLLGLKKSNKKGNLKLTNLNNGLTKSISKHSIIKEFGISKNYRGSFKAIIENEVIIIDLSKIINVLGDEKSVKKL